jgi:alcohol dehydrogenase class IV
MTRWAEIDVVLGIGGGRALDVSKLVAALLDSEETLREFFGIILLKGRRIYLACPRPSGTSNGDSFNSRGWLGPVRCVRSGTATIRKQEQTWRWAIFMVCCVWGPVNMAVVHTLAYPRGRRIPCGSGVSIAVLLPHVIRFNLPAAANRYADVGVALDVTMGPSTEETARCGLDLRVLDYEDV